jgi:DNA topoisomerase-2
MTSVKKNKTVEETFVKKTQLEHIIDIPDTYIGSIEKTDIDTWVFDESNDKIIYKNIKYIPGLYKIFDEVLVNAIDQHVRVESDEKVSNKVTIIKVNFDENNKKITVHNNGEGIPIVEHKEHGVWVPELIFGHLLTSSNYDKDEKKITGGKNGYGAKLTNIFSKSFRLETVDASRKLKYVQLFEKNMTIKHAPEITKSTAKPYTTIEFIPDFDRFGIEMLDTDTLQLMKKRVIDITACTNKNVSVFLNDKKLECKTLEKYVNYYLDGEIDKVYEEVNERWEVVVAVNPDAKFDQVSFVNGISTLKGGKHVDYVASSIIKKVQTFASTKGIKRKKIDLKPSHIKDNLFVFVRAIIENPSFDSQIKEYLTTPSTKFGSKCEVSEKFIEKLMKTDLIERATKLSDFKDNLGLQKVSGKKTTNLRGVEKLDDANMAGSAESLKCTLILTEGDSAKALAVAGLSVVGRDYFGVFPLRGKVLNVRDVNLKKVSDNAEISNLVKIMGLKYGNGLGTGKAKDKNETIKDLRYGRIMIFTDADVDGSHIKGLLINLFSIFWPELLEIPGFIISLATPILKVKKNKDVKEFYTMTEFNTWKDTIENIKIWDIKYYKGLGTSTSEEAKGYFANFDDKNIAYMVCDGDEDMENKKISIDKIEMAFDKKRTEDRKFWLKTYDKDNIIEQSQKKILYHEFIDKELIHFSDYDCKRSIPCLCDGLKPSLRKILYSCFKRNLKKEIKVAQLAGYISEHSAYHHGEQSLYESIIGMAQDYVGANNIELLEPKGQFGTRLTSGGKDAASPRYIFTNLSELTFHIYNQLDNPLLEYNEDDGCKIEPVWYIPIIPMILVNGTDGIGTGYSTKVPPHDPELIVQNLINLMDDKPIMKMKPWFRGFNGEIEFKGINDFGLEQYFNKGTFKLVDDTTIIIDELPIGKWTDDYKIFLESLLYDKSNAIEVKANKQILVDFSNNSTEKTVNFTLKFKKDDLDNLKHNNDIENIFKLTDSKYTNYSNMHLYNNKGIICKYDTVEDIMKEFYAIRLAYYGKRKEYMLKSMKRELDIFSAKIRFIEEFISGEISILHKEDEEIEAMLVERNYPKFGSNADAAFMLKEGEEEDIEKYSYEYLLNMKIKSLTKKKIEELKTLYENKLALYKELEANDEKTLWKNDLTKFLEVYREKLAIYNEKMESLKKKPAAKTVAKKAVVKKAVAKK